MKKIFYFLCIICLCACSNDIPKEVCESTPMTRSVLSDTIYHFNYYNDQSIENIVFTYNGAAYLITQTSFYVSTFATIGSASIEKNMEIAQAPSWTNISYERASYATYAVRIAVDENTGGERRGTIVMRQPDSNKTLSLDVIQYGRENAVSIVAKPLSDKCYEMTLSTQYPMLASSTVFRVQYSAFINGKITEEYAFFTLMKGESKASVTIDRSAEDNFVITNFIKAEVTTSSSDVYDFTYSFQL